MTSITWTLQDKGNPAAKDYSGWADVLISEGATITLSCDDEARVSIGVLTLEAVPDTPLQNDEKAEASDVYRGKTYDDEATPLRVTWRLHNVGGLATIEITGFDDVITSALDGQDDDAPADGEEREFELSPLAEDSTKTIKGCAFSASVAYASGKSVASKNGDTGKATWTHEVTYDKTTKRPACRCFVTKRYDFLSDSWSVVTGTERTEPSADEIKASYPVTETDVVESETGTTICLFGSNTGAARTKSVKAATKISCGKTHYVSFSQEAYAKPGGGNGKPSVVPGGDGDGGTGTGGGSGSGGSGSGGSDGVVDDVGVVDDGGDSGDGGEDLNAFRVVPQTQYKPAGEAAELSVSFYGDDPVPVRVLATDCTASTDGTIFVPASAKEASAFYWNASGELAVAYVFEESGGGDSGGGDSGGGDSGGGDSGGGDSGGGDSGGGDSGGGDSGGGSGCGGSVTPPPEPEAFLWANPPRLVFPLAGGVLGVVVSSSSPWSVESGFETISFSRERGGDYTPRKLEGLPAGDAVELFVRVAEDSDAVETPLIFRNEEGEEFIVELRVEDETSDPGKDLFPVLSLSPAYLSGADAQARAWTLNVSSNREFAIDPASVPEWLSVATAGGAPAAAASALTEADCPLRVRAAANASLEARAARLSFSTAPKDADEASTTRGLSVAQAGAAPNALLSSAATVAAAGGSFPLRGYARAGWAWSVAARDASAFPEWLAPAAAEAAGTGASAEFACAFAVAANTGVEARECVLLVSFTDAESGAAETLEFTVSQAASATPFLELNHSAGTVNPAAGELTLEISTNCADGNISAESSAPDWLSAELSGSRLILRHSANASLRARTASVVVRESEFGLEARFALTQEAACAFHGSIFVGVARASGGKLRLGGFRLRVPRGC